MTEHKRYGKRARGLYRILIVVCTLALILAVIAYYFLSGRPQPSGGIMEIPREVPADPDAIKDGLHLRTGLIVAEGYKEVINNCTNCHSASLVTQNRMDAKGWEATIKWMQETQNLWQLGEQKDIIINYLVTNYPVIRKGRREVLKGIEWYELEE